MYRVFLKKPHPTSQNATLPKMLALGFHIGTGSLHMERELEQWKA
jgi:hypothetical protein